MKPNKFRWVLLLGLPATALLAISPSVAAAGSARSVAPLAETLGYHSFQGVSATSSRHAFAVGHYGLYARGRIKVWDGREWNNATTSVGKDAYLQSVDAVSKSDSWAVGYYSDRRDGKGTHGLTMHWDGMRWSVVRGPQPSEQKYLWDVSMSASDDAWAVGNTNNVPQEGDSQTLVKHWDGATWSEVPSPNPDDGWNQLTTVAAVSADDVWAAGRSGSGMILIHWDGAEWSEVPAQEARLTDLVAIAADDVWAVGTQYVDGAQETITEHWDGSAWQVVPSPSPDSTYGDVLTGVTAVSSDDVWAVGYERGSLYYPTATIIEHWDGHRWRLVDSPDPGTIVNGLTGVSADTAGDAWAVGSYASQADDTDLTKPLLVHWDGTTWKKISANGG